MTGRKAGELPTLDAGSETDSRKELATLAEREVIARHRFFVEWFTGRADDAAMEDSARVFPADMSVIGPDATQMNGTEIVSMLRAERARRPSDFAIRIVLHEARALGPDVVAIVYDEHQTMSGRRSARRSSAIFIRDDAVPGGVVWRHLHETWIIDRP